MTKSRFIKIAEYILPEKRITIVYNKDKNIHYYIKYENKTIAITEEEDYNNVLQFCLANEAYKNDCYNLNSYPQPEDFK